jgi:type I restriction enzyme S subunit
MREGWQEVKIKEVCQTIVDCVNKTAPTVDYPTSYKMIRTTNVKSGWIDTDNVKYVEKDTYDKWTRRQKPIEGDVILTREAPLGEVGMLRSDESIMLGQRLVAYRTNPNKLNNSFLLYAFQTKSLYNQVISLGSGSTVAHMRVPDAEEIVLTLPSISTQNEIASFISAYDDLIENNEKRIKILEEMAQRLYTEWFVKFKFPGHENVKMVDSGTEYGMIPEGWEVKKLGEYIEIIRGVSYSSQEISEQNGDYYIVNLKSFNRGGGFRYEGEKYFTGKVKLSQVLQAGDVVVAVTDMTADRAVVARPASIPNTIEKPITFSADVVKVSSNKIPNEFLYYLFSTPNFTSITKAKANGANVLHLKPDAIGEYLALLPENYVLKVFSDVVKSHFESVNKLQIVNTQSLLIRDHLIENLVTGKRNIHI